MLVCLLSMLALAQEPAVPTLNAQLYRTPVDSGASMWTDDAGTSEGNFPVARLSAGFANSPLVYTSGEGDRYAVLDKAVGANIIVGYNIGRLRLAVDAPVYFATSDVSAGAVGLGDGAADVRLTALDPEDGLGLAFGTRLTAPTNTTGLPLGSGQWTVDAQAIVEARPSDALRIVGNLGYRHREKVELSGLRLGDQLFLRAGGSYEVIDEAGVTADLNLSASPASLGSIGSMPGEWMLGGFYEIDESISIRGGLGSALTPGVGAPNLRAVALVSYRGVHISDLDGDGLPDRDDQCVAQAEDIDGHLDADGCPDHDNDADGIADEADECRDEPEDIDGFEDTDGCPDNKTEVLIRITDPEGYLVPGAATFITQEGSPLNMRGSGEMRVDLHPGMYTLSASALGWWPLNEVIGVRATDEMTVEHMLEPVEPMGSVELTVLSPFGEPIDATWAIGRGTDLPVVLGHASGKVAAGSTELLIRVDGAAPLRLPIVVEADEVNLVEARVRVPRIELEPSGQLVFNEGQIEFGKNWVREESYVLLDEVADFALDNPRLGRLRIEVHTDQRGSSTLNEKVSQARAKSVKLYLISAGMPATRIDAVGRGEMELLDDSETPEAYEANRRVELWFENAPK